MEGINFGLSVNSWRPLTQGGFSKFQLTGMIECRGAKIKTQKIPGPKMNLKKIP